MKVLKCFGSQSNEIMEEDMVMHLNANLSCQDGYWCWKFRLQGTFGRVPSTMGEGSWRRLGGCLNFGGKRVASCFGSYESF